KSTDFLISRLRKSLIFVPFADGRQPICVATEQKHESNSIEEYDTRNDCTKASFPDGTSVPRMRQTATRQTRRRPQKVPDVGFCARLFLASTQSLPVLHPAFEQFRILVGKVCSKSAARPNGSEAAQEARMALCHHLGVRAPWTRASREASFQNLQKP